MHCAPKIAIHNAMTMNEAKMLNAPVTRREFLNYAFLASLGLFCVTRGGATFLFALPRFGAGEFGGTFTLGLAGDVTPPTDAPPAPPYSARAWVSNVDRGVLALYNVCSHLGCPRNRTRTRDAARTPMQGGL